MSTYGGAYCLNRIYGFQKAVQQLPVALQGSKSAPFIEFVVGDLKMSTYDSLDYFMQLDISYSGEGTGTANSFTVTLAYLPKPMDRVNFIDEALSGVAADQKPCMLRYGYSGIPGYNLLSSEYECLVLGYSLQIRDNYLYYTINCISTGAKWRERRYNFGFAKEVDPINYIYQSWTRTDLGISKDYDLTIDQDAYGHVEKVDLGYIYNEDGEIVVGQSSLNDVTIYEFLDTVLSEVVDTDDATAYYWYEVIDVKNKKQFAIHRTLISEDTITSLFGNKNQIIFTFDWGGNHQDNSTNNLILGFDVDFKGEVNIATTEGILTTRSVYDNTGTLVEAEGMEDYQVGDFVKQDFSNTTKFWAKSVNWAYTAQLEIVGVPADIPIGGYIEINPLIYGNKHHTAGVYMITGSKSNITSGGFVTNLQLVKVIIPKGGSWYSQLPRKLVEYRMSPQNKNYADLVVALTNGTASRETIENSGLVMGGKDYVYAPGLSNEEYEELMEQMKQSSSTTSSGIMTNDKVEEKVDSNIYINRTDIGTDWMTSSLRQQEEPIINPDFMKRI